MLTIRPEQIEALRAASRRAFEDEMLHAALERWPATASALGPEGTTAFIRAAIERAVDHGIDNEESVRRFVDLTFRLGRGMTRVYPWAAETVSAPDLSARGKVNVLETRARMELGDAPFEAMEGGVVTGSGRSGA